MEQHHTVICTFRVKSSAVDAFGALLDRHWPILRSLGFVTDAPEQVYVKDSADEPVFVSIFEWASSDAVGRAHQHPDVAEIWEAMEPLCEERDGAPSMEFPHYRVASDRVLRLRAT